MTSTSRSHGRPHPASTAGRSSSSSTARDPIVMGIGFAAIRDIVSFLRHATKDNPLAPQERPRIRYALGFGMSQSGRVLRDLVYLGFNQDLAGRQVFDGILPVVAGLRRTCINWQFAQVGR